MTLRTRSGAQDGAVAVMTAILAVALIGFAAFAVDLGNGFARKRMLQTQADLAALAGGGSLPDASAAIQGATDYLIANEVIGDQGFAALTDGQRGNGEIIVKNNNTRIEVVTPPASVGVGLGRVLGQSDYDVQAVAEAEIRSPARILPFFIPANCAAAAGEIVIKQGAQSGVPVFLQPDSNAPQTATVSAVSPLVFVIGVGGEILVRGDTFADNPNTSTVVMQIGFVNGSTQVVKDVTAGQVTLNTGAPTLDQIRFMLPPEVYNVAGKWFVQVRKTSGSNNAVKWSRAVNSEEAGYVFRVGAVATPDGCGVKETGDFGQLHSPRTDSGGSQLNGAEKTLDLNIARGLDHDVSKFTGALPAISDADNCRVSPANTPIAGGTLDDWPSRSDSPNCVYIETGNKVDAATDGLVVGGSWDGGFTGKLDAPATTGCTNPSDQRALRPNVIGRNINDDILSCFITNRNVNGFINGNDANAQLTANIYNSPRFFFVPVLHAVVNPQKGYYPIVDWRGVFITDQYSGLTPDNGLKVSNTKITEIKVAYFSFNRLPTQIDPGGQPTTEYLGSGTKVVVLVR